GTTQSGGLDNRTPKTPGFTHLGERITQEPTEIIDVIRCTPATPRNCVIEQPTLADIRAKIEKHLKNTRLKQLQAPVGVKPILKAWMELN
ncbi:MAG: hypothetical protein O3A00_26225, partial [Planctomycetota bacterium]|nr:hypothetical protein [Planctomycetota bacterium]